MIRQARFADQPHILDLMVEMHQRSRYRDIDTVDLKLARATIIQSTQRHGAPGAGGTCVFVNEAEGMVDGFVIGVLDRLYHIGHKLMATDMFLYAAANASARAGLGLIDALGDWASANENVMELWSGASDAIDGWERTERLYQLKGMRQIGVIYERKLR